MHTLISLRKFIAFACISSLFIITNVSAQSSAYIGGYKQVKHLGGTSQSICRPAIHTADELQSFALNQRQDIVDILKSADWKGNPAAVFKAIEAGDFVEKSFPVGTKLAWMGLRKKGQPVAAEKRQWAGKQAFEGFALNLVSNCQQHQLVIPKACCNVSLIKSTPVNINSPVVLASASQQNATITVNSFGADQITTLTHPDGHKETLSLSNGVWTGALSPGDYRVESRTVSDCGESTLVSKSLNIAPIPPVVMAAAAAPLPISSGLFLAPFIGRQIRSVDPFLVGVQAGKLNPINEKISWLVQGGGSYNTDVKELSIYFDLGLERNIGETGFVGGGVGLWDINNSDNITNSEKTKKDISYFIHAGTDTRWQIKNKPVQWYGEFRIFDDFTSDISHHNIVRFGLRLMQ